MRWTETLVCLLATTGCTVHVMQEPAQPAAFYAQPAPAPMHSLPLRPATRPARSPARPVVAYTPSAEPATNAPPAAAHPPAAHPPAAHPPAMHPSTRPPAAHPAPVAGKPQPKPRPAKPVRPVDDWKLPAGGPQPIGPAYVWRKPRPEDLAPGDNRAPVRVRSTSVAQTQ